ncbi:MAG: M48 family metalloprotease [Terriglobales bacterium]
MAARAPCALVWVRILLAAGVSLAGQHPALGHQAPREAPTEAVGEAKGEAAAPALLVTGHEVFQALVKSPDVTEAGAGLEWRFLLLNDRSVNAHSDSKGTVWVGGGLAEMLGQDRGLWAAVLSHEVAHCLLRHSSLGLTALHRAFPYVFGKVLRDREHRADFTGMMLMARAGYHPDSLFVLHHLLRAAHGERPGAVAFFGSHPRWQTREQRLEQALPEAVAAFTQAWPDAAASPGGPPPLVVFLGKPRVVEDRDRKLSRILVPLSCRNAAEPVTVLVQFEPKHPEVRTTISCADRAGSEVEVELRADQFAVQKLQARVEVLRADGAVRAVSPRFSVVLPER